jgi:mycothiol synthase
MTLDEMRSWFEVPNLVMLVAELPDGRIGGYADLVDHAEEHLRFPIDLRVPPGEHEREIAAALLEAMEAQAAAMAAPGASVRLSVPATYEAAGRLAEEQGYERFRYSFRMRIDLDGDLAEPEWPEGISVRPFVPGRDDEAVYEAQNDAFADHFEHTPWPYDNWREWAFTESFDPTFWFLAEDGMEIAGVCLCRSQAGAGGELGWVNVLGVRRPWRRRGLGRALLLHSFAEFGARGKRGAGLGVDGLNPTGAVQLYEQAGMHVARRLDQYTKPLSV